MLNDMVTALCFLPLHCILIAIVPLPSPDNIIGNELIYKAC